MFFGGLYFKYLLLFHECFACMCVAIPHVCLEPVDARRGGQNTWSGVEDGCKLPGRAGN